MTANREHLLKFEDRGYLSQKEMRMRLRNVQFNAEAEVVKPHDKAFRQLGLVAPIEMVRTGRLRKATIACRANPASVTTEA